MASMNQAKARHSHGGGHSEAFRAYREPEELRNRKVIKSFGNRGKPLKSPDSDE
jgi:hypothetical protein